MTTFDMTPKWLLEYDEEQNQSWLEITATLRDRKEDILVQACMDARQIITEEE